MKKFDDLGSILNSISKTRDLKKKVKIGNQSLNEKCISSGKKGWFEKMWDHFFLRLKQFPFFFSNVRNSWLCRIS